MCNVTDIVFRLFFIGGRREGHQPIAASGCESPPLSVQFTPANHQGHVHPDRGHRQRVRVAGRQSVVRCGRASVVSRAELRFRGELSEFYVSESRPRGV